MAVSLDAGMIAVSHFGGDVRIWTAPFDRDQQPAVLRRHKATPRGLYFFRDDTTLLTAGTDRVVKLIDIPLSQERLNLEGGVAIFDGITVSPDEKVIAAIGRNGNVFVWRAATPAEVAGTPGWTRHETTRIDASDPSQKPPIPGTIP
jgi:WD40 repeat protein